MTYEIKDPDAPATNKQTWAIKCLGGGDVREAGLTRKTASDMIGELKAAKAQKTELRRDCDKVMAAGNTFEYANLYAQANDVGHRAGMDSSPTPMTVEGMGETWHVAEGACGFAWVNFSMKSGMGRKFGQWLIKSGNARKDSYQGGCTIWISDHGQSIDRKSAHARAMAQVLQEAGIESAYADSRMD